MTIIDMHAHFVPRAFADLLRARSEPPRMLQDDGKEYLNMLLGRLAVDPLFDSIEQRIAEMDEGGITRAVLSNLVQDISTLPIEEGVPLCRAYNDAISAACAKYPDRLSAFAAIPATSINAAVEEFDRAMALPGIIGCIIPLDAFLSAERAKKIAPLLETADRQRAVVLAHYGRLADDPTAPQPDLSDNRTLRIGTLDMQGRLSSAMMTFCFTDLLSKYPHLTMMTHNLGGNIPFEAERLDHRALINNPDNERPSKAFRQTKLLIDCNSLGARSIELAVEVYGADKIVFGSDGTDFGVQWTKKAIADARITDAEKQLILAGNAASAIDRGAR